MSITNLNLNKISIITFISISLIYTNNNLISKCKKNIEDFDNLGFITKRVKENVINKIKNQKRKNETFTIGVYIAADNDLFPFAGRNIKQMQNVGSNSRLNLIAQFNMHKTGGKKISKRLLIKQNKVLQIGQDFSADSGSVDTFLDFCKWQIENFPADNHVLILWNHGTGIIEPNRKRAINPSELFKYNPETKLIELDRSIGFLDYIINKQLEEENNLKNNRGICFDDSTKNYITNKDLKYALEIVSKNYLNGKKLAILACDACLMSMIEVIIPLKDYADFFVSSQEIVLGTGYDYSKTFEPFLNNYLSKEQFVKHIVQTYQSTYSKITNDYTQSAIDLSKISPLEENITKLANILIKGLEKQKNNSVKNAIKISRAKNNCTHFDEPTYIDLGHFYENLIKNLNNCTLINTQETNNFKNSLTKILTDGLNIIKQTVFANVTGRNLSKATGFSIYFPETRIHNSYQQSEFAHKTKWIEFLKNYIKN